MYSSDVSMPVLSNDERRRLSVILCQVEADLTGNVLPFWLSSLDRRFGGFVTELDQYGRWTNCTDKWLVAQARIVWAYSAAYRYGITHPHYLQMAEQGAHFLMDRMWDPRHGGFYWCLRRNGRVRFDQKYLYGQAFGIYALAEYYLATGDREALSFAQQTFRLIETKAKDANHGYLENFARQWDRPISIAWGASRIPTPCQKTMNAHIHLMEALTVLLMATGSELHRGALSDLLDLILDNALHPQYGVAHELFSREWEPSPAKNGLYYTSYGHNVEFAWLLADAVDALGESRNRVKSVSAGLLDHALQYGFDWAHGGLASSGPCVGPVLEASDYHDVAGLRKEWWVQAENLVSTITAYRWMHNTEYLAAFEKQWGWIYSHQIDHEGGDWYREADFSTGEVHDTHKGKMGGWKCCYHNGRALMRVSSTLREILQGLRSHDTLYAIPPI